MRGIRFSKHMQYDPLPNYLRTYRKRAYLSQDALAFLLGVKDGSVVSRYEGDLRTPSFETAIALEIIFGVPLRELFPGTYRKVEAEVLRRARLLREEVSSLKARLPDALAESPDDLTPHNHEPQA